MTKPKDAQPSQAQPLRAVRDRVQPHRASSAADRIPHSNGALNGSGHDKKNGSSDMACSLKNNKEIKKLIDMGVQRGYLTFIEVNELLPPEIITPDAIDEIMNLLGENEIEVIDAAKRPKDGEEDEEAGEEGPIGRAPRRLRRRRRPKKLSAAAAGEYARGADPVKLYLKKMGSVSLLTREGEVEIAKRIEEGEVEILRALLASKLGTLAIVDLGERLETGRTKVKDVIRGVDEEVSADDEKKYLDRVLNAISKVKSLVNYQEKVDDKLDGPKSKKTRRSKKKEEIQKEVKKRERHVETAFQDIAFNRKTINLLSTKIKDYWKRGSDLLVDRKKVYDFLIIKDAKQMKEISRDYQQESGQSCRALQAVRRQRTEAHAAHPAGRRDSEDA